MRYCINFKSLVKYKASTWSNNIHIYRVLVQQKIFTTIKTPWTEF